MSSSPSDVNNDLFTGLIKIQSQEMPFAYFPHDCSMEEILKVIVREWNLDFPKIMLLVLSDNVTLQGWDSYEERSKFIKGLIKSSNATSMWIFTNGLNIGMSKVIGNAFEENFNERYAQICTRHAKEKIGFSKLPLIGLCSDNMLTYQDQFEFPEKVMLLENQGNNVEEQKFNLNPNHTHFLITKDQPTTKDYSYDFLLTLVGTLRKAEVSESMDESIFPKSPVPIVAILIQGNMNLVVYVLEHLKQRLPVLIIKGSGGLADVFAYAYYETQRCFQKIKDKDYVETIFRRALNAKITSIFPGLKDNKMAQNFLCERILKCIEVANPPQLKYITVLDVADLSCNMEKLPYYLLEVLFKSRQKEILSKHDQLKKDLQLILDWNFPEIALTKVFYEDPSFKISKDIFEQAILQKGREEFVSLFLNNGFEVHKYVNTGTMIKLFQQSLKEDFFIEVCWEGILGYRNKKKLTKSFIDSDLNWIVESLTGICITVKADELDNASREIFDKKFSKEVNVNIAKQRSLMLLIIWSLVSKRAELAMVLWQHTDYPIMTALTASLILDKMKPLISDTKTKEHVSEVCLKFASMAVGVFDLCYNDLPSKAYELLHARRIEWTGLSVIDLASLAHNRTFVAHPCCQKWLTNKFMGNIKFRDLSWGFITFPIYIKVILCVFFVFPMYFWVRFKEATVHEFVGSDELEKSIPYYIPDPEEKKLTAPREEIARTHLLEYQYPPLWQMIYYMWTAPITKFWVSNIFYMMYLAVFTLAVIWPSCGNVYLDSIVCVWTLLIAVDSMYRLYSIHEAFPNIPLFGSCLEIIYILIFVLFYYLLRVLNSEAFRDPYTGKILICMALIYFYYRMIFIYLPISSTLGPLLYRVKTMITVDFVNFMKLVVFILLANGIAIQSLLYPDYPLIPELIRKSFHKAIVIFFITPIAELTAKNPNCVKWEQKPASETMCRVSNYVDGKCSDGINFWAYLVVFHFVLLMKLVLMTVLFALFKWHYYDEPLIRKIQLSRTCPAPADGDVPDKMFCTVYILDVPESSVICSTPEIFNSATGARIGAETDSIWKFQRYKLVINFSNTLRLPPPLNIFSLFIIACKFLVSCCRKGLFFVKQEKDIQPDKMDENEEDQYLSSQNSTYWRQLAYEYLASKAREKEEEEYVKKELDILSELCDDLQVQEKLIYRTTAQIKQMESDICHIHAELETLKYRIKKEDAPKIILHSLSRESPYPQTKVHRFLVPDKYVPWEVTWVHYEPPIYSMPKKNFSEYLQPYVDDDLMIKTESTVQKYDKKVYYFNNEAVDNNGVYRNRISWIKDLNDQPITYKLDSVFSLPRNPMGRTGLRGKGALPRWGPNHNVFAIITRRSKKIESSKREDLMETPDHLEYVEKWFMKKQNISLPGGYAWSEKRYEVIQSCFTMDEHSKPWETSEDLISFFKDYVVGLLDSESTEAAKSVEEKFTSNLVCSGYMDDQLNTDQAWKEVELWHFHYHLWTNLSRKFKANIRWRLLSEEVFTHLPYGQSVLLQNALKHMNAKIVDEILNK